MRDLLEISQKIYHVIKDEPECTSIKYEIEQFIQDISYQAPEMRVASGGWHILYDVLMSYKEMYHSRLWYCQIVSIFSTRSLDETIAALNDEYADEQKSTEQEDSNGSEHC